MSNSDNPKNGADFQRAVQRYFIQEYGAGFELEKRYLLANQQKSISSISLILTNIL